MRIQKKYWFVIALALIFFVGAEIYSYGKALKEIDSASAVTVGVPNPGHSLSQLECNANSLCVDTANGRVGIGTVNPTTKLDVNGVLNLNSNKITGVAVPTASTDAATKAYVDAAGGGVYDSCYVLNSATSGIACNSGYTVIAQRSGTVWSFNPLYNTMTNAVFLSVGGGLIQATFSGTTSDSKYLWWSGPTNSWATNSPQQYPYGLAYAYLTMNLNDTLYTSTAVQSCTRAGNSDQERYSGPGSCTSPTVMAGSFALCCK